MSGDRLAGKVAFISGTGRGIGRAAATLFAAEGAKVFGCDRDGASSAETVEIVRAAGGEMDATSADLADPAAAREWVATGVAAFGGIDVLYNNAGSVRFGGVLDVTPEDWSHTLRNDLDTVMWATQAAWPHLAERDRSAIVNTAGIAGVLGQPLFGQSAAAATKAAVSALTVQHAAEGAVHGIRVNAVGPGPTDTPAFREVLVQTLGLGSEPGTGFEAPELSALDDHPVVGMIATARDAAECALFLASDEARFVNGVTVMVDAGRSVVDGTPAWA